MKMFLKHIMIMLIGIHLFIGGMIRIHHHSEDNMICFCIDGKIDPVCDHHHDSCPDKNGHATEDHTGCHSSHNKEASCAYHIDDFNLSDDNESNQHNLSLSKISIAAVIFCTPTICNPESTKIIPHYDGVPIETLPATTSARRGPPSC